MAGCVDRVEVLIEGGLIGWLVPFHEKCFLSAGLVGLTGVCVGRGWVDWLVGTFPGEVFPVGGFGGADQHMYASGGEGEGDI